MRSTWDGFGKECFIYCGAAGRAPHDQELATSGTPRGSWFGLLVRSRPVVRAERLREENKLGLRPLPKAKPDEGHAGHRRLGASSESSKTRTASRNCCHHPPSLLRRGAVANAASSSRLRAGQQTLWPRQASRSARLNPALANSRPSDRDSSYRVDLQVRWRG